MKSGKFDTPFDFNPVLNIDNYHIEYISPMEVVQGGPVVGRLSINNEILVNYRFGGPFLYTGQYIYIPVLYKSAFILSRIDLHDDYSINFIGSPKGIISLERIENDKIYYFDSLERTKLKIYDLSDYKISDDKDTPEKFGNKIFFKDNTIEYINIHPVDKAHPPIGKILLNNKNISKYDFGGPFLYNDSFVIVPVYIKRFFTSGFKIAWISLENGDIQIKGKYSKTIFLSEVRNNKVYYYEDFDKKHINWIDMN